MPTTPFFHVPYELFPVVHRFMDLDGGRIHYVNEGAGETLLLLLHGNPSWCFLYRKIIVGLRSDFRCVALDFPGYGMSDAPPGYRFTQEHSVVLEHFVDRLGLKDLTIMMQDWGGPIGLGFGGRRPQLVRRLIIGNTFAWPLESDRRIRIFSWIMGGPIGRWLTSAFNFVPKFFFTRGLAQHHAPEILAMYLAPWHDRGRRTAAVIAPRQLIAASPYLRTVEANLSKLADRPTLIVWGTEDFAFRNAERERFERLFPKHKTVLLDDASHFLQEDAGDQISESIRAWSKLN